MAAYVTVRLLAADDAVMMLLVPSDVQHPRRVDEHFAAEAGAARDAGHQVVLVDHDALAAGDAHRAVRGVPADAVAVYRGWMLDSQRYARSSTRSSPSCPPIVTARRRASRRVA
jgi:hypothetical protein